MKQLGTPTRIINSIIGSILIIAGVWLMFDFLIKFFAFVIGLFLVGAGLFLLARKWV